MRIKCLDCPKTFKNNNDFNNHQCVIDAMKLSMEELHEKMRMRT